MKQYGFFVDSTKCTGCKTCQISCKDEKKLDLGPKLRRVYEYGGGSWAKQNNIWYKMSSTTICLSPATTAHRPPA